MKLPTSRRCDQGNERSPSLGAATSHGADSGTPTGLAGETSLMQMSVTQKRKKAETPKLWGREETYLGENSFSSRYFRSLWPPLLSNMQAGSNVFVTETGQGGWGGEER